MDYDYDYVPDSVIQILRQPLHLYGKVRRTGTCRSIRLVQKRHIMQLKCPTTVNCLTLNIKTIENLQLRLTGQLIFKEVDDTSQHVIGSIESTINRANLDQNLDKTRKIGVVWTKLKNGEDLSRSEPTSYATRNIDNTKILAFMMNFDVYMLNLIIQCTNSTRILFSFKKPKICRCQFDTAGP
ncbi:hypothetical protein BpHYR1_022697 [Brachionus plicatilis]|uniref:Uncharacterized protein n=1 Tax=Brachionus plicatilis TaxID=10195 RepID=A0A3M7RCN2_BRAPC|nr:hypothetical protein BpHYR1_022697 [Brachionus plicatilis]